ncbi:MAG: Lrp/AsnC family transcriptional regulator [Sphingomonas sp.]|jgi:Lrp/AsnC family transcriptional regulator
MTKNIQFDAIDRRIIAALQNDASPSQNALAEQVGTSPASCWRRVRALEEAGVFRGTVRLVDPDALGRAVTIVAQVRMRAHDQAACDAFEDFVAAHEEIMECYSMSGEWDYQLLVVMADVAAYEKFLMRELLVHPAVATASSHFALKRVKYSTAIAV